MLDFFSIQMRKMKKSQFHTYLDLFNFPTHEIQVYSLVVEILHA